MIERPQFTLQKDLSIADNSGFFNPVSVDISWVAVADA